MLFRKLRTENFRFGERKRERVKDITSTADRLKENRVIGYGLAIRYTLRQMIVCFGG